jgi:hypothetical protein
MVLLDKPSKTNGRVARPHGTLCRREASALSHGHAPGEWGSAAYTSRPTGDAISLQMSEALWTVELGSCFVDLGPHGPVVRGCAHVEMRRLCGDCSVTHKVFEAYRVLLTWTREPTE